MEEVKKLLEEQKKAFEAFKQANDAELAEIKKKGHADPVLKAQVDKANEDISRIQKDMEELAKKASRVSSAPEDEDKKVKAEHRKAFNAWMRKGKNEEQLADLQVKATTLSVGVDADGGYAVPEDLERMIGTMERQLTPMEAEVSVITVGNETYEKLMADGAASSGGWVAETAARTATTTPTLAQFRPSFGEVYAMPQATQKMLDDAFFDAEAWLADEVAQSFAQDIDAAILNGSGTNRPKGILQHTIAATADSSRAYGTIEKLHSGSAGDFDTDDLIDLVHKLRPNYRNGAKFALAGATVAKVRKFKNSDGDYLWQPAIAEGQQSRLLGFPIVEDENVPAVASAAHAVIFANFKRAYKLCIVRGVRVLRDPYTNKPHVAFYSTKRVGGGVEDSRAVKLLTLSV